MDLTRTALLLDGRGEVDQPVNLFTFGEAQMRWLCWLYGYRLEVFHQHSSPYQSARVRAVLDPDPRAQARAAWMRSPDLRPGAPAPVPWTSLHAGGQPPVWTPPGWPPGSGPVWPEPGRMPQPSPDQIRERYRPAGLLVFAGVFALLAAALAAGAPAAAAALGAAALACLAGYLPFKRHRDRLIEQAGAQRPPYPPAPGDGPPLPPGTLAPGRADREDDR